MIYKSTFIIKHNNIKSKCLLIHEKSSGDFRSDLKAPANRAKREGSFFVVVTREIRSMD